MSTGKRPRERGTGASTPISAQLIHTPFCTADRLADGASFRTGNRRIGMLEKQQAETCCWTCLKADAQVLCANCNTGRYCSEECRTVDSLVHAQFCKIDGKFYWPPAPKLVMD